ncbi:DNA mismatch repair protein MutS [Flavobacterium sp. J372]|uniref:DNA mismatch repair protein MutS n=1 Tax=Flavobacterium sp. J372 TaxID=2898436 RepID=UPI0021508B6A|nr:DNA mismatch repair protein MutS [Flavobacterium sp. J372]MCR5862634.1 DNA mismatch repair protein MutS [Flavobacterium sp. J372]
MTTQKFKIGDKAAVLDDSFSGVVKSCSNGKVTLETSEGFLLQFDASELIKINNDNDLGSLFKGKSLGAVLREKEEPKKRSFTREKKSRKDDITLEIDLHIEKLVKKKGGMSNYEILTLQSETARRQLDFAIANRIPKVVFIHGVGEGVLKAELEFLFGRYDNIIVSEADYQKYGLGALQVYIKQNPKR